MPASWGESSANSIPSVCSSTSAIGSYATATNTVFPAGQTSTGATTVRGSPTATSCPTATSVAVTFNVVETTTYGETVYISGSISQLGDWNTASAMALSAADYTSTNNVWFVTINLPPGTSFQYKYFKTETSGAITWEADPDRSYSVPTGTANAVTENDTWQS